MNTPSALVLRFLASIGRPAEAELYLKLFRAERPESFALIAVDREVVGVGVDALAVDLEFLSQLGLTPILAFDSAAQAQQLAGALPDRVCAEVVAPAGAAQLARAGRIPLVAVQGDQLSALATALASRKLVLLGHEPALTPAGGEPLSLVDLTGEYAALSAPEVLPPRQRALLARARDLIEAAPHPLSVAVTSPLDLLRELFTVRGAGTLIRRGARVTAHRGLDDGVDRGRLGQLIESAFGRRLCADFWQRPIDQVYLAGDYRGAALIGATELGPYLSKLAVDAQARGEGIARDLWRALARDLPSLFWRARATNPIAPWYQEQSDGLVKLGEWRVFWRGLDESRIADAIRLARAAPLDFDD